MIPKKITIQIVQLDKIVPILLVCVLCTFNLTGQLSTWTGSVSSDWNDPNNWSPVGVPTNTYDITLPNVATDPIIMPTGFAQEAKSVTIDAGAILTLQNGTQLNVIGSTTDGIHVQGTLINDGEIFISDVDNHGIFNNGGTVTNNGGLFVGRFATIDKNSIRNTGTFTNNSSIVCGSGNINLANLSGSFINNGLFSVDKFSAISNTGILNRATIENNDQISIEKSDLGIQNEQSGNLTNKSFGQITVDSNGDALRLTGTSVFNNDNCGNVTLNNRINNSATLVNDGFITLNSPIAHIPGSLTNNGFILDTQANFPTAGVTNNEIIINNQPASTTSCTTVNNVFDGSPNNFSVAFYLDQAVSMPDGSYDPVTNVYTASASTPLNSSLNTRYIQVTDVANSCSQVISWDIDVNNCSCNAFCFTGADKCWNSNNQVDNSWSNPNNWLPIGVPQTGDWAYIPSDPNCASAIVEYDYTNTVEIHRLRITFDAQLTVLAGKELPIKNVTGRPFNTMIQNNGTLINHGKITMSDGINSGLYNFNVVENHGEISVDKWSMSSAGWDGFRNYGGASFNNHPGSSLIFKNSAAGGDGFIMIGGDFFNHPNAIIEVFNVGGKGMELRSGSYLENMLNGTIDLYNISNPSDKLDIQLGAEVLWHGLVEAK